MTSTRKTKPTSFPLPSAMELAQLAATLAPQGPPDAAMEKAMAFYFEAVLRVRELPTEEKRLVFQFGTESRKCQLLAEPTKQLWDDVLTLGPDESANDEVRAFLDSNGLRLKRPRSVIENLRRFWNQPQKQVGFSVARMDIETLLKRCERVIGGKKTYAFPRHVLQMLADNAQARVKEAKRKGWKTRQGKNGV